MNPAAQIAYPKLRRKLPRADLTAKEAIHLIEAVDTRTPLGMRDRSVVDVLYATGMRNAELRALSLADVGEKTLTIRQGKGGKDRIVPLGTKTAACLSDYLQQARPWLAAHDGVHNIFLTKNGRPLDALAVINAVKRAAKSAGIKKELHPHLLRLALALKRVKPVQQIEIRERPLCQFLKSI